MATKKKAAGLPRITAWSPSRLYDYEACPRKAKYKIIDRLPDPGNAAMQRGTELHSQAEGYINGSISKLHPELKGVAKVLKAYRQEFKADAVRLELKLAFDAKWAPVDYFDKSVWLRMKVDLIHFLEGGKLHVIDWKTGRFKPDDVGYSDQLNLYAVSALSADHGTEATAALVFTDHGEVVEKPEGTVHMDALKQQQKKWTNRVQFMLNDTIYEPRPGRQCSWCPFSKSKGGPCDF